MVSSILLAAVGATFSSTIASASTLKLNARQSTDNTIPVGTNPIKVKSASYLGPITSDNSCSHRDLGFWGRINTTWYAVWGDTFHCKQPLTDPSQDTPDASNGFVRDAVSQNTSNPIKVHDVWLNQDKPVPHQSQFVRYNSDWGEDSSWGFGGTSICETDGPGYKGIIFYLRNANDAGLKGAGVGRVQVGYGWPVVVERYGTNGVWWNSDTEPRYGDKVAYRDERSDYIYAFGGSPGNIQGLNSNYVYATRVRAANAFDLSKYEYFWGPSAGWNSTRLTSFTPNTAIFWGAGQGQILWNPYYKVYVFCHLDIGGGQFLLRTSNTPYGPWTADVVAFNVTGNGLPYEGDRPSGYAGTAMPWFDTTGKTLIVSYTLYANLNPAHKITFA